MMLLTHLKETLLEASEKQQEVNDILREEFRNTAECGRNVLGQRERDGMELGEIVTGRDLDQPHGRGDVEVEAELE